MNAFRLSPTVSVKSVTARLQGLGHFREEPARRLRRYYCDSFDWRLYQAGAVVCKEQYDEHCTLAWLDLGNETPAVVQPVSTTARFAADLPPGHLRARLQSLLDMRALLPIIELDTRQRTLSLLDTEAKTVLRIVIESNTLHDPASGRRLRLGQRLCLHPLRGYAKAAKHMRRQLVRELQLTPAPGSLYSEALARRGIEPGSYSAKPTLALSAEMHADEACRRILLGLLDTLEANEEGTKQDLDSEFLHDFRVAVRRTRSALAQIKEVLPAATVRRFRAEFAWLGEITGPTRDLDVYRLQFPAYQGSLPENWRGDLEPLREYLDRHQRDEQAQLRKLLSSARYRRLTASWRAFLSRPLARRPKARNARRPIRDVASERIWRLYRRALKEGSAIGDQSPPTDLHEMRKTCKKLRYLLEFFTSLYPPHDMAALIATLKQLQDNLGTYQDCCVQIDSLRRFEDQMREEQGVGERTIAAMERLVVDVARRRNDARQAFAAVFAQFAADDLAAMFQRLFHCRDTAAAP